MLIVLVATVMKMAVMVDFSRSADNFHCDCTKSGGGNGGHGDVDKGKIVVLLGAEWQD